MGEIQVKVSSITQATRGRNILQDNGFRAYIKRTQNPGPGEGCGYSIYFSGDQARGLGILKYAGIRIIGTDAV